MRLLCPLLMILCLAGPPAFAGAAEKLDRKGAETVREEDAALGQLLNAPPDRVRARLGEPDVARAEGKGAFWTYQLDHCALFLFFHVGPKGLHLTGVSTGPRQRGEALLPVETCLASALRRSE